MGICAALALVWLFAACTTAVSPSHHPATSPKHVALSLCEGQPARQPKAVANNEPSEVPPGATAVRLCGPSKTISKRPTAGVLLGAYAASAIAVLINEGPSGGALTKRCAAIPPDVVLLFGYASREEIAVDVVEFGCPRSLAYLGGHARVLDATLTSTLVATAGFAGVRFTGALAPDVEGLPLVKARQVAAARGFDAADGGEEVDPFLKSGTVLLQYPPAGFPGIGRQLDLVIAVGREPPCSSADVVFQYIGSGVLNAFEDVGSIVVRDVSVRACLFPSTVNATGLNAADQPVTRTITAGIGLRTDLGVQQSLLVLSPRAIPIVGGQVPLSESVGDLSLTGGTCANHRLVPASFLLRFAAGTAIVANASSSPSDERSLVMCHGDDFGSLPA
ncbi:MAG: PASTA domain-containing protein [Acidimicrobiales bacterium]